MKYEKNVEIKNYLPKLGLQILSRTFFDKMFILCNAVLKKNTFENQKFHFSTIICEIRKKRKVEKLFILIRSTNFV